MSIFKRTVLLRSLFIVVTFIVSMNAYSGGVSERKHESKTHISSKGSNLYQLSLDDVLPSSRTTFISHPAENNEQKPEPILIRVTGYSGFASKAESESEAKRLLVRRASKLDAYRALAERVYGLSISSKSVVKDYVLKEDNFAVALNSHVRGARVVSVNEKKGVGFETVLELILPGNFNDCLNKVNTFKNGLNCLRPLPDTSLFQNVVEQGAENKKTRHSTGRYHGSGYFLN